MNTEKHTEMTIELPNEIVNAIEEEAKKQGISLEICASDILSQAVTHTIKNISVFSK